MTKEKVCLTPNAKWSFEFHPGEISVKVIYSDMQSILRPMGLAISRKDAVAMESALHDAIEPIIAARWTAQNAEYGALKAAERKRVKQ